MTTSRQTAIVLAPLASCSICGRRLNGQDQVQDAHKECCELLFGLDRLPMIQYVPEWEEYVYPFSSSSYLVSLHQDPQSRTLAPSFASCARFLLKIPAALDRTLANRQIENEWMTMLLARAFGVPALQGALVPVREHRKGLIMHRIDRKATFMKTHSLHIETLAQTYRWPSHHDRTDIVGNGTDVLRRSSYPRADAVDYLVRTLFSFLFSVPACDPRKLMLLEHGKRKERKLAPAYGLRISLDSRPDSSGCNYANVLSGRKQYLSLAHDLQLDRQTADRLLYRALASKEKILWLLKTMPLRELCDERRNLQKSIQQRYEKLNMLV